MHPLHRKLVVVCRSTAERQPKLPLVEQSTPVQASNRFAGLQLYLAVSVHQFRKKTLFLAFRTQVLEYRHRAPWLENTRNVFFAQDLL